MCSRLCCLPALHARQGTCRAGSVSRAGVLGGCPLIVPEPPGGWFAAAGRVIPKPQQLFPAGCQWVPALGSLRPLLRSCCFWAGKSPLHTHLSSDIPMGGGGLTELQRFCALGGPQWWECRCRRGAGTQQPQSPGPRGVFPAPSPSTPFPSRGWGWAALLEASTLGWEPRIPGSSRVCVDLRSPHRVNPSFTSGLRGGPAFCIFTEPFKSSLYTLFF